jgi:hypothetical protein
VSTEGNTGSKYLVCPIEIEEQIKVKTNRKLKYLQKVEKHLIPKLAL